MASETVTFTFPNREFVAADPIVMICSNCPEGSEEVPVDMLERHAIKAHQASTMQVGNRRRAQTV